MKKTLFTAVLAFVLSIGGVALFAEDEANAPASTVSSDLLTVVVSSKTNAKALTQGLSQLAANTQVEVTQDNFGYMVNGDFCSLAMAFAQSNSSTGSNTNLLGSFSEDSSQKIRHFSHITAWHAILNIYIQEAARPEYAAAREA